MSTIVWNMDEGQVQDAQRRIDQTNRHLEAASLELETLTNDYVGLYGVNIVLADLRNARTTMTFLRDHVQK